MKYLVLIMSLLLAGCATPVPVTMKFPAAPKDLQVTCPDLDKVDPNTVQLSEVMKVVTKNYGTYYECKAKIDNWIKWYNEQKAIMDSEAK